MCQWFVCCPSFTLSHHYTRYVKMCYLLLSFLSYAFLSCYSFFLLHISTSFRPHPFLLYLCPYLSSLFSTLSFSVPPGPTVPSHLAVSQSFHLPPSSSNFFTSFSHYSIFSSPILANSLSLSISLFSFSLSFLLILILILHCPHLIFSMTA